MERTRNDASEWNWRYVPKLLGESLLYPIRAGTPLRSLKSVVIGGLLISLFVFLLSSVGREGLRVAWREASIQSDQTAFILLVAIAVLLATVPFGYLLRVIQHASADEELPTFRNWKRLALLGIQITVIYFFYLSFPLEILSLMLADFGSILGGVLTTAPEIYLIVFLYLYPAAVARFAEEERLLAALPQRLRSTIWSWTYTVGAVTSGLIGGVIYVISRQPLEQTPPHLGILMGLVVFYLFIAQHYVIGRTWRAVEAERFTSEPLETPSGEPVPSERIDTGGLQEQGVLSTEDVNKIRGRFEAATRASDPDTRELLEALRTLYERGVFTEEEYEEKRREITSGARGTDLETGSTRELSEGPTRGSNRETRTTSRDESSEERPVTSEDRTEDVGGEADPDRAGFDREPTPTGETGTARDVDGAEDASDQLERFAMLHQLYGQDVLTKQEYETKQQKLGPDREMGEFPEGARSDLAERFATLQGLYDRGLLTEEEYEEKRQDLLEEF